MMETNGISKRLAYLKQSFFPSFLQYLELYINSWTTKFFFFDE